MLNSLLTTIADHGTAGVIDLSYGRAWVKATRNIFVAAEQTGIRTNKDINAGDPIGLGMGTVTCYQGKRVTAVSAYLSTTPSNLTIVTGALASKLVLEGKMVKGVETVDGRAFSAVSEVIVCAGALNSPQLLLLSGIGPGDELKKHGIPVLHELPAVGKNLQDHCFSTVGVVVKHSPEFEEEQTPLSPSPMAFLKSASALTSPEYHQLPWQVHRHLQAPTVPNFEMALVSKV
jgi:choline dehydrogenase-like flavoprotein